MKKKYKYEIEDEEEKDAIIITLIGSLIPIILLSVNFGKPSKISKETDDKYNNTLKNLEFELKEHSLLPKPDDEYIYKKNIEFNNYTITIDMVKYPTIIIDENENGIYDKDIDTVIDVGSKIYPYITDKDKVLYMEAKKLNVSAQLIKYITT